MLTIDMTQKLASHPERETNSIVTVYLDVDQSREANLHRGFERQCKDMLTTVQDTIKNPEELEAFEIASQHVKDFLTTYKVCAHGLAVVFDVFDGFFWSEELDFPTRNQIRWSTEVFLQPLTAAIDEYERVGIVLLDRANLRVFTMFLGETEERIREAFDHRKVRHIKTVGMDHLGAAGHAQQRADEQVRVNLRHVIKDIDLMLEQHDVRRIILAGSAEITSQLRALLPKRLASRIIGTVNVAASASIEQIRKAAVPVAEKFERDTEKIVVGTLVTSAAKSGGGVIGLEHTLNAVNLRRVWQLVYADSFHSPGYECPQCTALFSTQADSCSFCGSTVYAVENTVERAVHHAFRRGVKVEVIRSEEAESSLMNEGGIGAFIRTRKARAS